MNGKSDPKNKDLEKVDVFFKLETAATNMQANKILLKSCIIFINLFV